MASRFKVLAIIFSIALVMSVGVPLGTLKRLVHIDNSHVHASTDINAKKRSLTDADIKHLQNNLRKGHADDLLHMTRDDLFGVMGHPTLSRRDGSIEIWQYASQRCVLDVFMNNDDHRAPAVIHYEVRNTQRSSVLEVAYQDNLNKSDADTMQSCMKTIF